MNKLTLNQMQTNGMKDWMSDKEIEKQIQLALDEQKAIVEAPYEKSKSKEFIHLQEALVNGGKSKVELNGKKHLISVYTPDMMQEYDNASCRVEQGFELDLPPLYKYWIRTANGSIFTMKCQTYTEAEQIVKLVFDTSYRVSASKL